MAEQNFYDMTDTAENIDRVIHDLVEVVTEENDGKVLMVEKVVDEETDEVSVNIVEADLPVLEGNRNEIVVFDGEDWGKQSGVYAEGKEVSLFDTLPPAFFDSGRNLNWGEGVTVQAAYTDDLVVTNLVVFDITGDDEVVIYDMQTDELFSSVGFDSSPLFTRETWSNRGSFSISTDPNVITFPALESAENRGFGLRPELFDSERKYRFEVSVGEGEYELIASFVPGNSFSDNQVLILKTSNTGTITYSTTEVSGYHTTLSGNPSNIPNKQTTIVGDRNAKVPADTHFLALSGKARVTAHDNAKLDVTHNAQVFMHDDSRLHIDGSSDLFMHGSSRFNMNASAELYLHQDSQITSDGEARMNLHDKSILTMGDCAQVYIQGNNNKGADGKGARVILNGDSRFYMQSVGADSPEMALNGGSKFYMNGGYRDTGNYDPYMAISDKQIFINGNGKYPEGAYPTLAIGDSAKVYVDKDSWVKVSDRVQIHMLDDSFTQMTGNSHSEMHNDSFFIMKNRPENSALERKAQELYEAENLAVCIIHVDNSRKAEIKAVGNGFIRNRAVYGTKQPAIYDSSGTRLAGTNESNQIFNLEIVEGTSYFPGTYTHQYEYFRLRSSTSFILVKQGAIDATVINELYELPEGATGIFWEDLTEEEKFPWYKKADNGHEKVEGSPFFQMVNNSSIDLDDGIDITGDSTGLYLNNEKIATEYSYETEEEGETVFNTVNIEKLFTELQSALVRIAELEEIIQTLNP